MVEAMKLAMGRPRGVGTATPDFADVPMGEAAGAGLRGRSGRKLIGERASLEIQARRARRAQSAPAAGAEGLVALSARHRRAVSATRREMQELFDRRGRLSLGGGDRRGGRRHAGPHEGRHLPSRRHRPLGQTSSP